MKPQRIVRKTEWTEEQRRQHSAIRERFRREQPSRDELIARGEVVEVGSLGELVDTLAAARQLKQLRESSGISLTNVAAATGIEEAVLIGLESGTWIAKIELDTLYKYAHAVGGDLRFSVQPLGNP